MGCCDRKKNDDVRQTVRDAYGKIATGGKSCRCCGDAAKAAQPDAFAAALGYSADDLSTLPEGANMGLSCGNPTAIATLQPGEVVLDLGSGGGFDVFIVAQKVGPTGLAIGVDMTPDMVSKARANAEVFAARTGLSNVDFRLGEIERLPVADASVDAIISNCVINLSPDKPQVWREMARVLKPGGRVAVSDLALLAPLPQAVRDSVAALVGCIAGAVLASDTEAMAKAAGLIDVTLTPRPGYIDAMIDWNDPLYRSVAGHLPPGKRMSDFVTSLYVNARKGA